MPRKKIKKYAFTWATGTFYSRDSKGKIKRIKAKSIPKSKRLEIIKNAPNFK